MDHERQPAIRSMLGEVRFSFAIEPLPYKEWLATYQKALKPPSYGLARPLVLWLMIALGLLSWVAYTDLSGQLFLYISSLNWSMEFEGWDIFYIILVVSFILIIFLLVVPLALAIGNYYQHAYDSTPAFSRPWTMTFFDSGVLAEREDGFEFVRWSSLTRISVEEFWALTFSGANVLVFRQSALAAQAPEVEAFVRSRANTR